MKPLLLSALLFAPSLTRAQGPPVLTIGGDRGIELGVILDAVATSGRFVILDKNAPHLRVVSETGQLLQTTGRSGSGPGEFRVPWALAMDSAANTLFVLDPANARITEYVLDDTLRLARTLPTSVINLRDLCSINGRYYGNSGSNTQLLDELEVRGGRMVSRRPLGEPRSAHPSAAHPLVAKRSSEGPLLCDSAGAVWVASRYLGELHRVNPVTETQETLALTSFHGIRMTPSGANSLTFSAPDDGRYEEVSGLVALASGVRVILTQFDREGSIRGYQFLDVASDLKSQSTRRPASWREMGATMRGVVCVANDPVPTLSVFEGARCP
jgi:hypothetical protein